MAGRTKLRVVAGYDKSEDKTESCKKQSVAQRLWLYGTGKVTDDLE